jgi:quinol-cytochrome oxidoreductase complex cytochrome b subunit
MWAGEAVGPEVLNRFLTFHFVLPAILLGGTVIHIAYLHMDSSTNPKALIKGVQKDWFQFYFLKDVFFLLLLMAFTVIVMRVSPDLFSHPDN